MNLFKHLDVYNFCKSKFCDEIVIEWEKAGRIFGGKVLILLCYVHTEKLLWNKKLQ